MYALEDYTPDERRVLARYFTNSDRPVFALINLPEIVKGALFARYSRTHTPLRRLFLDEFYKYQEVGVAAISDQLDSADGSDDGGGESKSMRRAERLFDRVFVEYGDDSVAQLGGAHLACEQVSALAIKAIERGRLAAYLEQSTRYIEYDARVRYPDDSRRFRYVIPPEVERSHLREMYVESLDRLFGVYSALVQTLKTLFESRFPRAEGTSGAAHRAAIRAKACDTARGLLPAATYSNVGVFATGQAYEMMLLRMRAHQLQEVRDYAQLMLTELRKVIPGFLKRVDVEDRGVQWSRYLTDAESAISEIASNFEPTADGTSNSFDYDADEVKLLDWDTDADTNLTAACLFASSDASEAELVKQAASMTDSEAARVIAAYVGDRTNRRHRPGRGFERINYRFEILSDFGSFRDLQRHRMMTIEWQRLGVKHGYSIPPELAELPKDVTDQWHRGMAEAAQLYAVIDRELGSEVAQYVVPFAHRIRYVVQLNARQAMHILELRTSQAGHSDYRRICLKMHQLIRDQAGHSAIADAMTFIDREDYGLGRLSAERRRDARGDSRLDVGGG